MFFCEHRLAEALCRNEHDVAGGLDELEAQYVVHELTIDLPRPSPVEVRDRLETPDLGTRKTTFEAALSPIGDLVLLDVLERCNDAPPLARREGDEVVEIGRNPPKVEFHE